MGWHWNLNENINDTESTIGFGISAANVRENGPLEKVTEYARRIELKFSHQSIRRRSHGASLKLPERDGITNRLVTEFRRASSPGKACESLSSHRRTRFHIICVYLCPSVAKSSEALDLRLTYRVVRRDCTQAATGKTRCLLYWPQIHTDGVERDYGREC